MSDDVDDRHGAFTLDELSDYLDADRTTVRADIEGDPDAVAALERLQVLRRASRDLLNTEASADGKGIDHFFYAYGDAIVSAFRAGQAYAPPA